MVEVVEMENAEDQGPHSAQANERGRRSLLASGQGRRAAQRCPACFAIAPLSMGRVPSHAAPRCLSKSIRLPTRRRRSRGGSSPKRDEVEYG
jgi:hypothetical protein